MAMRVPARAAATLAAVVLLALGAAACGDDESVAVGSPESNRAIAEYRDYLERNANRLVTTVDELRGPIRTAKVTRAESLYAIARVPYSQIEPVAELFPRLDAMINPPLGEEPPGSRGGFHVIEKSLWTDETTAGLKPVAEQLLANVEELRRRVETAPLRPAEILAGARRILRDTATVKLAGEEERHAESDLVDVAANVEGAHAAFKALRPLLGPESEQVAEIEEAFRAAYAELTEHGELAREPNKGFPKAKGAFMVFYSEVSKAELAKVKRKIDAVTAALPEELPDD